MRSGPEPGSPAEEGSEGAVADGRPEPTDRGGPGGAAAPGPGGAGADRPAAEQHQQVQQVRLTRGWFTALGADLNKSSVHIRSDIHL